MQGSVFNLEDWLVVAAFVAVMLGIVLTRCARKPVPARIISFPAGTATGCRSARRSSRRTSAPSISWGCGRGLRDRHGDGALGDPVLAHPRARWVFVPLYDRMKIFTMPEFLELRFSRGSRNVLSLLTIASLVLTKIAVTIYAGDVVVRTLLGIDTVNIFGFQVDIFWVIALGLAFTTGLYTVLGGLRVIMYTAVLQAPVLILGSLCILYAGLNALGHGDLVAGWHATVQAVGAKIHLIRPLDDPDWSWAAVLPGSAIIGFWYWCNRPIHRAARARRTEPAAIAARHDPGGVPEADTGLHLPRSRHDRVRTDQGAGKRFPYKWRCRLYVPGGADPAARAARHGGLLDDRGADGVAGVEIQRLGDAVHDGFLREWYPNASGRSEVVVGRIATAVIVVMGICWVLVIKSLHSDLYVYLQSVQGYLSPAIAVLFLLGVFWKRATAPAALWAFVIGVAGGFARLAADLVMRDDGVTVTALKQQLYAHAISQDRYDAAVAAIRDRHGWVFDFWNIHWLYYTQILLVVTAVLMIAISLVTRAPDPATMKFTWYGATSQEKAATRASWNGLDVALSLVVVLAVAVFYAVFW